MARFECKKCGNLLTVERSTKNVICNVCGKKQNVPDWVFDEESAVDHDPRQIHYEQLVRTARKYRDIKILTETANEFERLGDYENSREMAEYCRKRITEEKAKRNAESKVRDIDKERIAKGKKWYHIKLAMLNLSVVALVVVLTLLGNKLLKRPIYNRAESLMSEGKYEEAIFYLEKAGRYKNSEELLETCQNTILDARYTQAIADLEKGYHIFAMEQFKDLNGYKDSETYIFECQYRLAQKYMDEGKYELALEKFSNILDYKDAAEMSKSAKQKLGITN